MCVRFLWLAMFALGLGSAAAAWGQSQPLEAAIRAEQPPAGDRPPPTAAQPPVSQAAETPRPVTGPAVEASQLDTFLLRDSKGNLVPVLGLPFEEFEQLLRVKKGLAPPPARDMCWRSCR